MLHILIASHACSLPQNQKLFALAAQRRGWKVTMLLPSNWRNEYGGMHEASILEGFSANMVSAPVIKSGSVPLHFYFASVSRLLRRLRPDVVYSHNEAYSLSTMQLCYANAVSGGRPFGFFSCQNIAKRYPAPFRQFESWVYRKSSFFIPITEAVDKVHRQKGYHGDSCIIPLGFDSANYSTNISVSGRHLNSICPFRLAYIGRVVEEKGLLTLAYALGNIKHLDWRLIIVGSGPFERELRNAIERSGVSERVEWRGFVKHEEVARFYETVDTLILPSETRPNWTEQFGRVLVEAMACGTPVIGSDSGEIPNIIRESGGGIIFKQADQNACAAAISEMICDKNQRARMAAIGHSYVHGRYALDALAERFGDVIEAAARK